MQAWQASKEVEATGYLTKEQAEGLAALGREESARRAQAERERNEREAEERHRAETKRKAREAEERRRAEAKRKAREAEERRRAQAEREAREAEERRKRARSPGDTFRDCPECPELVVVPSGSYRMGSPSSEKGRYDDEDPVHRVAIGRPFAVGVHEVTRGEFGRFVSESGRSMGNSCWVIAGGEIRDRSGSNWKSPGFSQTDEHPVVCVKWSDAKAYVEWLSVKTGKEYRLLSEAEWEYVARAGTRTARYWGESKSDQCRYANGADETLLWPEAHCVDGYSWTSPVGSFEANPFGLHDVYENVYEWVEDCWKNSYRGAPGDGSAWVSGNCGLRVMRGGSLADPPRHLRSAFRNGDSTGMRGFVLGFRVARTLTP